MIEAIRADAVWHRLLGEYYAMAQHDPTLRDALRRPRGARHGRRSHERWMRPSFRSG